MTAQIIDLTDFFKAKTWLVQHHNAAWKIHDQHALEYQLTGDKQELSFAQQWMEMAINLGEQLDALGGAL